MITPRGFKFLWAIDLIDADINIDGIQQVFFSQAIFFVPDGVEGYKAIGYSGRAAVLERAVQTVFGEPLGRARLELRSDLDDVWEKLDALEEEYFADPMVMLG